MIKDNSMNYIIDLPTEVKNGVVELVEKQLTKLEEEFEKL